MGYSRRSDLSAKSLARVSERSNFANVVPFPRSRRFHAAAEPDEGGRAAGNAALLAVAALIVVGGVFLLNVVSGDRDTFQLASDRTTILYPVRAGEMARITPAEVRDRYGVDPKQVPDFIALRGDPSDKLPGARYTGPKGAASLLQRYGTLEDVLASGRFPTQAEQLRTFRSIASMDASTPTPRLHDQKPTWGRAASLAREWGLKPLADRLAARTTGVRA